MFAYTGAAQTWAVPAGVTSATFDLYGAQGGGNAPEFHNFQPGLGGELRATLDVVPGASLQVNVGGRGLGYTGGVFVPSRAFGGGGLSCYFGGAGGSDVRIGGTDLHSRRLVAGGGGGAGTTTDGSAPANGGAGGGTSGDDGGTAGYADSIAGGGGTQDAGGTSAVDPGGFGIGGDGGGICGGGGGGGWYGGGGGDDAAGGGGSSYPDPAKAPAGVTDISTNTGVRSGDGLVTISYPACTATGFVRDGIDLTAKQIGGDVTGALDASGCDIGVYYGPGSTGNVTGASITGAKSFGVVNDTRPTVNVTGSTIAQIGNSPFDGSQHGVGILYTTEHTVGVSFGQAGGTISGNTLPSYQKGGITVRGTGASATIQNNTVTGAGPVNYIAQNGIQVSYGASALVTGNTVSGNWYTPAGTTSCGLLFYQAGGVKQSANVLTGNQTNLCNAGRGGGQYTP